jgi:hypothetical protein
MEYEITHYADPPTAEQLACNHRIHFVSGEWGNEYVIYCQDRREVIAALLELCMQTGILDIRHVVRFGA